MKHNRGYLQLWSWRWQPRTSKPLLVHPSCLCVNLVQERWGLSLVGAATIIIFVMTKLSSQQTHVCHDKTHLLSWQSIFLSQQKFCHDRYFHNIILLWQAYICHDRTHLLLQQNFCNDKHNNFVVTELLSWQAYFCHNNRHVLLRQTRVLLQQSFCHNKTFVVTKLLSQQKWYLWQFPPVVEVLLYDCVTGIALLLRCLCAEFHMPADVSISKCDGVQRFCSVCQ